ncbi:MAG TPA: hypothetical protein VM487_08805 [Phycisphaerae bacterium]|nr:hypothetical protein [Phycisphaerae bacterium]
MKAASGVRALGYPSPRVILVSVALISTALIAYEIVLMRRLLIERWHHFGYLVISVALLGFGASGTLLAVFERRVRQRTLTALRLSAIGLALSLSLLPRLAAWLPITARFIPQDLWRQAGWWSLYWLAAAIPFLLGATHIGAALMTAGRQVGRVYAVNLFGSGVGALLGGLLVSRWPVEAGLWPALALAWVAAGVLTAAREINAPRFGRLARTVLVTALVVGAVVLEARRPLLLNPDEFKDLTRVRQLETQGMARCVARASDPHGYVEIYESDLFHDLPLLHISESPPPMFSILINGDVAGSVLRIQDASQAGVMDRTLMAFPYRLLGPEPRVLLLGETGGTNVWLARRRAASEIVVVQPNSALTDLFRGPAPLADSTGNVFEGSDVRLESAAPRQFLASNRAIAFDLIQIVSLEGLGLGGAGMRGLAEDHLVTVEGFAECLQVLGDTGALAITRGLQTPRRENIRLLATLAEALELIGIEEPAPHIVQVRDYLGACTVALRSPLDDERRAQLRKAIREFNLTPVWYDGLPIQEVNQPDAQEGPPGSDVDWLHHAAREIFSDRREGFYQTWLTNVQPVHDDNPFFWDFYKAGAVAELRRLYKDLWLTRAELGRLFLYASMVIAGAAAVIMILVPLALAGMRARIARRREYRRWVQTHPTVWTVVYFGAIGIAFMAIEMALISRAIRSLGDPVIASALVIGGILVVSGLGSLTGRRVLRGRLWQPATVVATLGVVAASVGWSVYGQQLWTTWGPTLLGVLVIPLAYCMGVPMPSGIAALSTRSPSLVPWAWGVNGVASVIGSSLAIVVAMVSGYRYVLALAAGLYALAALAAVALGRDSEADATALSHNNITREAD